MRNFTFNWFKYFKPHFLILFFLLIASSASAQFYTNHYIAPAPWQYFSDANEIVIATNSTTTVNIAVSKSDGTLITNLTAVKGTPAVYRFTGSPTADTAKAYAFNTVLNGAGLIVTASGPVAINLRNVASDAFADKEIKGNAALTSFGDAGIGVKYRIGYYRDGSLGNFGGYGDQRPIYTIMAINNGTSIKLNGTVITTLNAGQSYLFKAAIGSLVESSNSTVMNTSAAIDTPNGCGDGAFNQIPPESVLGSEYFIERGKGNDTAEQTTVVATKPNTTLTINTFSATGTLTGTVTKTLVNAGDFYTFLNGISNTNFSASRVFATNNVAVYSGTAQSCEVDISTIAPVSECGGSNFIETAKFRNYGNGTLPYFGYILLKDPSAAVNVNGVNVETISGISPRHQLGTTGWYIINFEDTQIGSPNVISVSSTAKMTISIVQQGGGFSMAGFFSNFAQIPEDPSLTYVSGGGCTNSSATLTTPSGFAPYQWYYNGTAISGATTNTYIASKTGSYSVSSTLSCGSVSQSKPTSVTLCTDLGVTKTVNVAAPCVNSNVEFTVKVSNLGVNNATGVSINDLLPSGYTYVSSVPSTGTYNTTSGVWSIGDLDPSAVVTLSVIATVNASGSYNNTASFPATMTDSNSANNSASISTTPKAAPSVLSLTGSTICVSPGGNGTITSSTSVSGVNYQLYNSANTAVQTVKAGTGSGLIWSGLAAGTGYYVTGTNADGCNSKSAAVNVATTPNPISLVLTGSTICASPGGNGTITSSTSVSGVNYQLYNSGNIAVQTIKAGTGSGLTWSGLSAATGYYVVSTNAANCTANSNTAAVSTTANPIALSLTGSTICVSPGGNGTITSSTSVSGVNYQLYNSGNVAVQALKAGTGSGLTWSGLPTGTGYYVISTNTATCTATSNTVNISTTANPIALSLTGSTICIPANGGTVTSSTSVSGVNYQLYNSANVAVQALKAGTGSGLTWSGLSAGTGYYVISINAANCTATSTSVNIVADTQKPTITCPSDVAKTADANSCAATGVVLGTPITADNCGVASVTNNAPVSYPIGVTIVTWTVTDNSGNTATCAQTVTITDTQKPTITCPADIAKTTDANSCTATGVVLGTPTTADNCGVASVTNNAPSSYPIGVTIVTWTVTDNSGNTATCSQTVKIVGPIVANDDNVATFNGYIGGTAVISVLGNDLLNCNITNINDINITLASTLPSFLNFNTSTGSVTVNPNTPAGVYTFDYAICEKLNPTNCSTATVSISVSAPTIDAVTETTTSINGNTGGTTASLTANDTLNGNAIVIGTSPGEIKLTGVTVPSGLSLNANGTVTVASNTPAGNYNVEYSICEITNPGNCDTVISIITVGAGTLVANADTIPSLVATNASQTLVNVFDNDTKNGVALVPSDVNLTVTTADPTGYLTIDTNGNAILGANAPAGNYELTYTICEKLNPINCSSNTVKVTVGLATIDAVTETTTSINGNTGGTTTSLTANDTLNGNPVVIGTNPGEVKLTGITVPSGLTLNANGTVTVAPNTQAGNYNVEYSICEITNPSNCDAVISIITVSAGTLVANADTVPSLVATNASQTLVNVFDNDTKNGVALVPSDVNLIVTTADPTGYLTIDANGNAILGANAPAGNYELTYTICEKLNPTNCSSNTVKVTVGSATIDAVTETTTSINGNTGGTTTSLTANDTLNGNPVVIGTNPGEVKLTGITVPSGLTLNANGTVTVASNTPAGNYNVEYSICEITNSGNCDTVTSVVVVSAGTLVANADTVPLLVATNASQTLVNVFDNDTKNGVVLIPSDVNLIVTTADPTGYLTIDANGNAILGANAPAGNYELTYTICEKLNPINCSSNTVKATVVSATIDAVTETTTSINGDTGGTTASLTANDTLNGNPVVIGTNPGEVKLTGITVPSGLTLNTNGTVTVAPNTPAGSYEIEYSICEITNPTNCDTVKSIVVVTGSSLQANGDIVGSVVGINQPTSILNVFDNDTKNGLPVVANEMNLTITLTDPKGYLTLNPDGTVTLGANAPGGTYELQYQICEKLNPANCSSASVKVSVVAPTMTITANSYCSNNVPYVSYNVVADNFTPTNLLTVKWIDSANNVVATQTNLPLSGNILWPGAIVDGNGNGLDWPGWIFANGEWTEGTDGFENTRRKVTIEFSLNPTQDVVVEYPAATSDCNAQPTFIIKANNDAAGPIDVTKTTSASLNVFDNDSFNGLPINPANTILSTVAANANLVLNANGSVDIKTGTQSGTYQLTYQICDISNSGNCSQAVVIVTVLNSVIPVTPNNPIIAKDDAEIAVDGINGSLEFINILDNDLLNGLPVNANDVIITNTSGNSNFEFNSDGTVNVLPGTPGAHYTLTYMICEKATQSNCSSATLNVFVEVPSVAIVKTAVFNDENNSKYANAGETITYKFKITNTGNVPLKNITITDPLPGVVVSGQSIDLDVNEIDENTFTATYIIKQSDINLGTVTNQATVKGTSARGVVVDDKSDDTDNTGDKATVISLSGCVIKVFNAFSPNGDSKNTRFYIQGLECYPDNTVEIYNRWGVLVFDIDHYNNEDRAFKGFSEGRTTVKQSDGLPVGTYYYILKYKDNDSNPHELTGYLYLNK